MTDITTLRWGDSEQVTFMTPSAVLLFPGKLGASKQLIQAHWRWPLSWNLLMLAQPTFATGEAGMFTARFTTTVGIGQAITTYNYDFSLTPPLYTPIVSQVFVPAQDLQVTMTLIGAPTLIATQETILLGAFVAPQTEPHAMTRILDQTPGGDPPPARRWMHGNPANPFDVVTPPFDDGELHYKRYR